MRQINLTQTHILAISASATPDIVSGIINHQSVLDDFGIVSRNHLGHFLGQCAYETQGFTRLEENLYYTTAERVYAVFKGPSSNPRFKSVKDATKYVRNPQALANLAYGGRYGNSEPDDGWNYRGSSMKMTTFKANYEDVEKFGKIDCVNHPELLRHFPGAMIAAAVYWIKHSLARFADRQDIAGLTKAIQGGDAGLDGRKIYTDRALRALNLAGSVSLILRSGSKGADVQELQRMLNAVGSYGLTVDGDFGRATEDAVEDFQASKGLLSDGVVGAITWGALKNAGID